MILKLDSQKAYRVFENLLVNITKYALPHTRVYIDVEETEQEAVIRMKNVSAAELDFDTEEITRAIPVIVGATDATKILRGGISVGVDASQGLVYNAASRNNSELKGEE